MAIVLCFRMPRAMRNALVKVDMELHLRQCFPSTHGCDVLRSVQCFQHVGGFALHRDGFVAALQCQQRTGARFQRLGQLVAALAQLLL